MASGDHDFLIAAASGAGWDAFWEAVAASVGDRAKTGDLAPLPATQFATAVRAAVAAWVEANVPEEG